MSTEIKKNAPIKNTLFSFVTMRAPQLPDEKQKEKGFVFRDESVGGDFDEAVSVRVAPQSKWDAMKTVCDNTSFQESTLSSDSAVRSLNEKLYDFSVWLARNRSNYDLVKLNNWKIIVTAIDINSSEYKSLWNNLFYQVITQKDFYVKEALIHVLVANNLLLNFDRSESEIADLMQAKVVLPKSLFVEEAINITSAARKSDDDTKPCYPDLDMLNIQTIATANLNNERYSKLLKQLVLVEKKYRKEFDAEYKKQYAAYVLIHKKTWSEYYAALEEAKRSWCAIRDPKIPYDANNPCDQPPYVAMPDVPEFEFVFRSEMDIPFFEANLTSESFETLIEIVGMNDKLEDAKKNNAKLTGNIQTSDSFVEVTDVINNAITTANNAIYNATKVNFPSYVSFGGLVIPVASRIVNSLKYRLCYNTISPGKLNFYLSFDVPDSSWQVTNFHCAATLNDNTIVNSSPFVTPINPVNQNIIITNIFPAFSSQNLIDLTKMNGEITFANGEVRTFKVVGTFSTSCVSGALMDEFIDDDPNPTTGNSPFIPKGFGYKQIGIADYKIVEQTVHCYVEGEVAHIENVMAREHRSKSTRKLTKTEDTITEKSEQEKEQITDTATTERYEMQSEVAQVIQNSRDFNASTDFHVSGGNWSLNAGMGMATHSSREQNTRQAITNAKEVVQKATERITTKVTKERIRKITEEFEENNIHEFDNRKGDKHVVGVYRWVDKVYKNQIINFGKRLMFEFMIPEPAKLHRLGMIVDPTAPIQPTSLFDMPIDPRKHEVNNNTPSSLNLSDFIKINDLTLKYWAGVYNVEFKPKPAPKLFAGKSIHLGGENADDYVEIPQGYHLVSYKVKTLHRGGGNQGNAGFGINGAGTYTNQIEGAWSGTVNSKLYQGKVPVAGFFRKAEAGYVHFDLEFDLNDVYLNEWKQETFKAIIDKYEEAKAIYDEKMEANKVEAVANKDTNPAFFKQMMNLILRKNCISYLIDQTATAQRTYGKDLSNHETTFGKYEIIADENLDDYGAFVKFIEQAFEWSIMSYYFYPYYWGNRENWKSMYQYNDSDDPLFRSFMQSGMARAIVTVRPGFEEAVSFYMQTGRIWNGGEVPVIEDKLFLAIVEELREPEGQKEGKAWATRLPTNLTILQANSIGLEVEKALPCNCDDLDDFENPEAVPCGDGFVMNNAQINGTTGTAKLFGKITGADGEIVRVTLKTADGLLQDVTNTDENGEWELKNVPAGTFTLLLDALDVFPDTAFEVTVGEKEQEITLAVNQILEVNITVHKK